MYQYTVLNFVRDSTNHNSGSELLGDTILHTRPKIRKKVLKAKGMTITVPRDLALGIFLPKLRDSTFLKTLIYTHSRTA
jgi:hypothetical protein